MGQDRTVLRPDGSLIDLDRGERVENLPADSIVMDKNSYGGTNRATGFFSFVVYITWEDCSF